jgi:hypothetical protein
MDELKATVETLIEIDEPEALLATLRRTAERRGGHRWERLAKALKDAETSLEDKPKGHDGHPGPAEDAPLPETAKAE